VFSAIPSWPLDDYVVACEVDDMKYVGEIQSAVCGMKLVREILLASINTTTQRKKFLSQPFFF
jgi:hypothetical protein